MFPFAIDLMWGDCSVRIRSCHVDMICLDNLRDFIVDSQDGLSLLVGIRQCGFELLMSCGQSLQKEGSSKGRVRTLLMK